MIRYTARAAEQLLKLEEDYSDAYLDELAATLERAEKLPSLGTPVRERPGVRRLRSRNHFLYIRHDADAMVVLRIEHTRRMRTF